MKKFLLLTLATLLISPCVSETTIKSSNNNNLTGNNNDSIVSEQSEDTYTIRFLNDEGTEICSNQYKFGVMPEKPATPSKEHPLDEYTYTFSGWSPSIGLVTADVDYVATYKADAKIGEVVWVDGDGEILLTENYAYGSMPNYHGDIPTKTATDTETYVFKGWSPEISVVSKESTTYVAQFSTVEEKYSIHINCTNCLVNKKKSINEKHDPLTDLTYQFNNTSEEMYHYPYKLEVTVDDKVSNDYAYDNITGELNIKLTGNTVINAVADNSCVLMKYKYSVDYPTVEIKCDGDFESVDWGDGTTIDATSKSHTYSHNPDIDQYDIRIFGNLSNIGTTSKAITSVNIFHSITLIGNTAFFNCSSLTSINIPNSVTSISENAFFNCSSLASVEVDKENPKYDSRDNCNAIIETQSNKLVVGCKNTIIPNSVTSIGNGAFRGCSSLTSIAIPNSVTLICDSAFRGCSSLTSITIPNSVTSVANGAFSHCSSLTSITIPDGVTSIGDDAFSYCSSLTSINIPNSVTSIGDDAFSLCYSLASIIIPNSVTSIGKHAFSSCTSLTIFCEFESKPNTWDSSWNSYDCFVYWGYLSLGSNSDFNYVVQQFNGTKKIAILKYIGDDTVVNIPSEINVDGAILPITSIGDYAFNGCSSLTSITIPDGVTSIGDYAFSYCSSLTSINIPNSVTSIGSYAFYECSSLTSITIPNSVTSVANGAFSHCSSLTSITIPNSVTSIGYEAFLYCRSLTSITIPNSVTSIGDRAFSLCYSLTSITIPNSVTSIGYGAFSYSSSLTIYCEVESEPSGWSSDWNYDNRAVVWGYIGTGEYNNLKYVISSIGGNKSIVIIGLVDKTVTTIDIPSTINVSGVDVAVTTIGYRAFYECSSLTSITIPNSVTSIGEYGFYNCFSLELLDLSSCDHIVSAGSKFLYKTKYTLQIKVKANLVEDYKSAPNWSDYADKIIGG